MILDTFLYEVGNTPIICGGIAFLPNETSPFGGSSINTTTCHGFNRHTQTWETFHDLNCPRQGASSVLLPCDGSLMIAGGWIEPDIEILDMHHGWKFGTAMPEARVAGCMLAINDCEVAYIGGASFLTQNGTSTIFIYNCETKEWRTASETLSKAPMVIMAIKIINTFHVFVAMNRYFHKCVLLKNPEGDRPTVVIFGGIETLGTFEIPSTFDDTVEFWDLETHQITQPSDPKFLSSFSNIGITFIRICMLSTYFHVVPYISLT